MGRFHLHGAYMKTKFTKTNVLQMKCPASGYIIAWDKKTPGLGLRLTANGARSFVFERRLHKRTVRTTIGDAITWELEAARIKARSLSVAIDGKRDPRIEAKEEADKAAAVRLEAQRQGLILEGVWATYVEDRRTAYDAKKRRPAWGDRHSKMHELLAAPGGVKKKRGKGLTKPGPLRALMPLRLEEITSERVSSWLTLESKKRPTNAAQSYRLLRTFVQWCSDYEKDGVRPYRGIVPADACSSNSVRKAVPGSNVKKDVLELGQLAAWFAAVQGLNNRTISAYLQVLLLTGARRNELARLKWADVRPDRMTLRDKVDGTRVIPLTPYVAQLLGSLQRKNQWVFASVRAEGGRLMEPRIAHNAALSAAEIEHLSLHGLRRSFATLPDYLDEMPAGVVAQIMGHKPSATAEKHYKVRQIDLLAKWHTKIETFILEQAGIAAPLPAAGLRVVAADGSVRATV